MATINKGVGSKCIPGYAVEYHYNAYDVNLVKVELIIYRKIIEKYWQNMAIPQKKKW